MSTPVGIGGFEMLSVAELETLIDELLGEEQSVSKRRAALHDRIEFVHAGGGSSPELAADQLASLRATERELSDRRLLLHQQIDEIRAERSRRLVGPAAP
jgi:predicted  nucleic acid-binding Zn-ribbon protein